MAHTIDFETALSELEKVVGELDGEVRLERALELFDRGMKLSIDCEAFLKAAEQKVELLKRNQAGNLITEQYETVSIEN